MFKGRDTLPPIVLQIVGLGSFLFMLAFWAITGKLAGELLAASGTLYGVGLAGEARRALKGSSENPPPVAPAPDSEGEK